jgi:hypothetical protein
MEVVVAGRAMIAPSLSTLVGLVAATSNFTNVSNVIKSCYGVL